MAAAEPGSERDSACAAALECALLLARSGLVLPGDLAIAEPRTTALKAVADAVAVLGAAAGEAPLLAALAAAGRV